MARSEEIQRPRKAVPLVFRDGKSGIEVLSFSHPRAGLQLVKGTIEPGESIEDAARRELEEESGLVCEVERFLGSSRNVVLDQDWYFVRMQRRALLPDAWAHVSAPDDGGFTFEFFWQPLDSPLSPDWHSAFVEAIDWLRSRVNATDSG